MLFKGICKHCFDVKSRDIFKLPWHLKILISYVNLSIKEYISTFSQINFSASLLGITCSVPAFKFIRTKSSFFLQEIILVIEGE